MAPTYPAPEELAPLSLNTSWQSAPPLGKRFDPFVFEQRMAMYRELLTATNRNEQFWDDNRQNPLWGLMFQHQWQFDTDRLGLDCRRTGRIDPNAGWGYGNYTLSVIPWLGAVAAGVVPDRALAGPPKPSKYENPEASRFDYISGPNEERRSIPTAYKPGILAWRKYFEAAAAHDGGDDEALRMLLWAAHKVCLDVASARLRTVDPKPYSPMELTFLQGWCRMVDFLWAAAWPTDFDFMLDNGLDVLPDRLLTDTTRDLPPQVRSNVRNVIGLASVPDKRYARNLKLWRRAMRTRSARRRVLPMLDAIFNPGTHNVGDIIQLIGYLLRPGKVQASEIPRHPSKWDGGTLQRMGFPDIGPRT